MMVLSVILGFFLPRTILLGGWLFGINQKIFEGWIWPLLGFLLMPCTTLMYLFSHYYSTGINGGWIALFILGVIADILSWIASCVE